MHDKTEGFLEHALFPNNFILNNYIQVHPYTCRRQKDKTDLVVIHLSVAEGENQPGVTQTANKTAAVV